jgi:hypothetical protein
MLVSMTYLFYAAYSFNLNYSYKHHNTFLGNRNKINSIESNNNGSAPCYL